MKTIILVFVFLFSNLLLIAQQEGDLLPADPPNPQQLRSQDPTYANIATPDEILVVYKNTVGNNDTSESIKDYYVSKRSIPSENVLGLYIPNSVTYQEGTVTLEQGGEDIRGSGNLGWRYVKDTIVIPIERHLNNTYVSGHPLSEKIRYIVLCKGIPLKVRSLPYVWDSRYRKQASVSALLCLINQPDPNKEIVDLYGTSVTSQLSPLFQVDNDITMNYRFESNHFLNAGDWYIQYLVSWLNGDDYDDVIAQIDRFADPDLSGEETWIIDGIIGRDFSTTNQKLTNLDFVTNYDNTEDWIVTNNDPVIGYVSNGVHAGMPPDYILDTLDFDYANGATFDSWESFNAYSFGVLTSTEIGQGQIADFIHMRGSGGSGHVYEPYLDGVTYPDRTFPAYAMGYSIVDAQYQGIYYLAWQNCVVGDPLSTIAWGKQTTTQNIEMKSTNLVTDTIHIDPGDTLSFASNSIINLKHHGFVVSNESSVLTLGNNVTLSSDSWARGLLLADSHDYPLLIWTVNPSMSPISYYKVYRKFDSGSWTLADSLTENSWIDSSLTFKKGNGMYHDSVYYYVKSYNSTSGSDPSNTVAAKLGTAIAVDLFNGWQIVSVPVIPESYSANSVFPTHVGTIYAYVPGSGYVPANTLQNGPGYWADFNSAQTIYHSGLAIDTLDISVPSGWSFLGSISYNVRASDVCQQPSGIITALYKYDHGYVLMPDGSYIEPGIGYWMHTSQSGHVILSKSCGMQKGTSLSEINLADLDKFILTDSLGHQQGLYVANIDIDSSLENLDRSMPPPMPVLGFDARFSSGDFIKVVSADSGLVDLQIDVESIAYPVTLSWEINPDNGIEYSFINDSTLGKMSKLMKNNSQTEFDKDSKGKIRLFGKISDNFKSTQIPKKYALYQNYPNPFNPTTTIKYSMAKDGFVTLDIYNILGERVTELVNQQQKAGTYEVVFNGSRLSSGVYFYKITSRDYSATKKMMLIR